MEISAQLVKQLRERTGAGMMECKKALVESKGDLGEAEIVLRYIRRAKESGIGVVFITHNVHHAHLIGDTFEILKRGSISETIDKANLDKDALLRHMAGGNELGRLELEFETKQFGSAID